MPGGYWGSEEIEFVKNLADKGEHPYDIWLEFRKVRHKKGFPKRTKLAVERVLYRMGYRWKGKPTRAEKEAEDLPIEDKIERDREIQDLRDKLQNMSEKYRAATRETSLEERLVEAVKKEVKCLPETELKWNPPVKGTKTEETAVLLLSDLHTGEIVDKKAMVGLGEYDFDIENKRLKFLADTVGNLRMNYLNNQKLPKLVIACLGDMVTGTIHQELVETGEDIVFQVMNGAFITAQLVLDLAQYFPVVEVDGIVGNHGRLTKKKKFKKPYINWDFIFYQYLGAFLAGNSRITCNFPESFFMTRKIYGWLFLSLHGDNIRSWAGIPWYGIQRKTAKLREIMQSKAQILNYVNLGHFHNTGALDQINGEILLNGSVIGGNEYSFGSLFTYDRPTQLFYGIHPKKGVTWRYPIRLDLPEVNEIKPYCYSKSPDANSYMKSLLEVERKR